MRPLGWVYMSGRHGEAGTTILTAVAAFLETATPLSTDLDGDESEERVRFSESPGAESRSHC